MVMPHFANNPPLIASSLLRMVHPDVLQATVVQGSRVLSRVRPQKLLLAKPLIPLLVRNPLQRFFRSSSYASPIPR